MKQITKFGRGTTLRQTIQELEENGLMEITHIERREDGVVFEYGVK